MLRKLFYKKHDVKKKRGIQSTSVPILVSDASIADLQNQLSRCNPNKKNETFQINTLRFIDPPKDSPIGSPTASPRSSPDNGSLNNFLPRDAIRICLPKKPVRICDPKESPTICFIKEPPQDVSSICPRVEKKGSQSSLNNFLPVEPPKSCLPKKRCKFCSKTKKTTFKDGCVLSSEIVSSDEADKCQCMQELYFNDEAKISGGSSPRGQACKERNSDFLKLQQECSIEALRRQIKEKKRRSCERDPKDSGATSSLAESASATCDASATYYHNKLLATLQILQNKEETISVQADSLAVAEERIASLNERANELKRELERKTKEYSALRKTVECCKPQQVDACFVTDRPIKVAELRGKLCELECNLSSKWDSDAKFQADIESKEQELARIREQLLRSQNSSREQSSTVESISTQLGQVKALLNEKTTEVTQLRQEKESQARKITDLQDELAKADQIIKENCKMRSEVAYLTTQVSLWRSQLDESKRRVQALESDLARTRAHAEHIDECYREKASKVAELQTHLEAAHARGTALCGEARRAVCSVRVWMRRMRDKHREKDAILKEKEGIIAVLRRRLEERQNDSPLTSASENTASCSKCLSNRDVHSYCSKTGRERQRQRPAPSANEMPSCSSTPTSTPMRLRKKPCGNNYVWICDEEMQAPVRRDAGSDAGHGAYACHHRDASVQHVRLTLERAPRDVSPTEDLLFRVEQLSEALADGNRRWSRPRDKR